MKIHPTSIVSPDAELGHGVEIGPFCIVESQATLGDGCRLVSHVVIKSGASLGNCNTVCENTVIGGLPQHANPPGLPGDVVIGNDNMFREHVTIHRAMHASAKTIVGSSCLFMAAAHVAHDCHVDDNVILTNGVMLGGHVHVGERACLGGNVAVHQNCRIGRIAMIAGCARVVQDVPPFVLTDDAALIVGLNRVGLKRAGFRREEIADLKEAYRVIYRQGHMFDETIAVLESQFNSTPAAEFAQFFQGGTRGFVQERRSPPKVALRVHPAVDEEHAPGDLANEQHLRRAG